jgi:thiol-disulfide isomerase/thioredoxin
VSEQIGSEAKRTTRRAGRWLVELAVVAIAFVAVHAFVTRGIVRGPLPPLHGVLADGTATSVTQWQQASGGDAFLLYVWATWCPICKTVEGSIDAVARDAPVLTVAMQSGSGAEVGRFLAARGYRWPTLVDGDARLSRQLGVDAVPTLIFVDRTGRVCAVTQGYTSEIGIRLRLWWAGRGG